MYSYKDRIKQIMRVHQVSITLHFFCQLVARWHNDSDSSTSDVVDLSNKEQGTQESTPVKGTNEDSSQPHNLARSRTESDVSVTLSYTHFSSTCKNRDTGNSFLAYP